MRHRSHELEQQLATLLGWRLTHARNADGDSIWRTPEGTSSVANWSRDPAKAQALREAYDLSIERQPGGVLVSKDDVAAFAAYHEYSCPEEALQSAILLACITKLTQENAPAVPQKRGWLSPGGL